jgi:hypothetical protein
MKAPDLWESSAFGSQRPFKGRKNGRVNDRSTGEMGQALRLNDRWGKGKGDRQGSPRFEFSFIQASTDSKLGTNIPDCTNPV